MSLNIQQYIKVAISGIWATKKKVFEQFAVTVGNVDALDVQEIHHNNNDFTPLSFKAYFTTALTGCKLVYPSLFLNCKLPLEKINRNFTKQERIKVLELDYTYIVKKKLLL